MNGRGLGHAPAAFSPSCTSAFADATHDHGDGGRGLLHCSLDVTRKTGKQGRASTHSQAGRGYTTWASFRSFAFCALRSIGFCRAQTVFPSLRRFGSAVCLSLSLLSRAYTALYFRTHPPPTPLPITMRTRTHTHALSPPLPLIHKENVPLLLLWWLAVSLSHTVDFLYTPSIQMHDG